MKKTKWQWISVITFFTGVAFQLLGLVTDSWFFIFGTFIFWYIALWCVAYRPTGVKNEKNI